MASSEVSSSSVDMAQEGADVLRQLTADQVKEEESQSTGVTHDENSHQQQHTEDSSAFTKIGDIKAGGENMEPAVDENGDSAEKKTPEKSSSPEDSTAQVDDGGRGDYDQDKPREETTAMKDEGSCCESSNESGEDNGCEETEGEPASSPHLSEGHETQVDGPASGLIEETEGTDDPIAESEEDAGSKSEQDLQDLDSLVPEDIYDRNKEIKTIGPIDQEPTEHPAPVNTGGVRYLVAVGIVALCVAVLVGHFRQPDSPLKKKDLPQVDIFLRQMEALKTQYPHQRTELWSRSRIHLLRHLQTLQPTEPVSLMLVAGHKAEKTLHCLAQSLASAFSSALNASVVHIDGASKASQDSDQVKLDIDTKLQGAFEGDKPVAVIHRFEELPPGSTLIFYRYCDHENAAYKKTCLIFTVLLGEEEEIPAKSHLSAVEEMVDDHLKMKFLSDGQPISFDRMDLDKYGGLWSRISHLILPVAADERIEQDGC